jgi:hypothetical protein
MTTSMGDARKLDLMFWWMRASKLRFPESTAATFRSFSLITFSMSGCSGPLLPMQVVQPKAAR